MNTSKITAVDFSSNNKITTFAQSVFENSSLAAIDIFESITTIADKAFKNTKLVGTLTVPTNVTIVGSEVFADIEELTDVTYLANVFGTYMFENDVNITTPLAGQVLKFDANTNKWISSAISVNAEWGSITGSIYNQSDLVSELAAKQAKICGFS